jgi:hypothetical protein
MRKIVILIAALVVMLAGIAGSFVKRARITSDGTQSPVREIRAQAARNGCPSPDRDDYYFTSGTFGSDDEFTGQWYSRNLRAMGEPSLSCGQLDGEAVYRFVWLRSFDAPISVRVVHSAGRTSVVAVTLTGQGGYDPGQVAHRGEAGRSAREWSELSNALEQTRFWAMPAISRHAMGVDGARWIVEGRRGDSYHLVDRWSPDKGAYRVAGLLFLKLAALLPDKRVY